MDFFVIFRILFDQCKLYLSGKDDFFATWHCAGKSLNSRVSERDNSRAAIIDNTGKTTVLPRFYGKEHGIALIGPEK